MHTESPQFHAWRETPACCRNFVRCTLLGSILIFTDFIVRLPLPLTVQFFSPIFYFRLNATPPQNVPIPSTTPLTWHPDAVQHFCNTVTRSTGRTRTRTKGFGDPHATITTKPQYLPLKLSLPLHTPQAIQLRLARQKFIRTDRPSFPIANPFTDFRRKFHVNRPPNQPPPLHPRE